LQTGEIDLTRSEEKTLGSNFFSTLTSTFFSTFFGSGFFSSIFGSGFFSSFFYTDKPGNLLLIY
jgi:hypothetical protein